MCGEPGQEQGWRKDWARQKVLQRPLLPRSSLGGNDSDPTCGQWGLHNATFPPQTPFSHQAIEGVLDKDFQFDIGEGGSERGSRD